jgi:hypothetical protein
MTLLNNFYLLGGNYEDSDGYETWQLKPMIMQIMLSKLNQLIK